MQTVVIRSEEDALAHLRKILDHNDQQDEALLKLEGWPVVSIKIQGEDFYGTVPTRIMPPLLELQNEVNRLFCVIKYGEDNLRKLTQADKKKTELIVKVNKGSSEFLTKLAEVMEKILLEGASKLSADQIQSLIIYFGLSVSAVWAMKVFLGHRETTLGHEKEIELTRIEAEKQRIMIEAMDRSEEIKHISHGINDFKLSLLKQIKEDDKLSINNQQTGESMIVNGNLAKKVTQKPRETTTERFHQDNYVITAIYFQDLDNLKMDLEDMRENTIRVSVPEGALSEAQRSVLKNKSFQRTPVLMNLLLRERYNRVTGASLISIGEELLKK